MNPFYCPACGMDFQADLIQREVRFCPTCSYSSPQIVVPAAQPAEAGQSPEFRSVPVDEVFRVAAREFGLPPKDSDSL